MSRKIKNRSTLRSVADALAALDDRELLEQNSTLLVSAHGFQLPSRDHFWLAAVSVDGKTDQAVAFPAAVEFSGITTDGSRQNFSMARIDGAVADVEGNATLSDGICLRAVEIVPVPLPHELTDKQRLILECAIEYSGMAEECYRSPAPDLLPDVRLLDFATLPLVQIDKLEALAEFVQSAFATHGHTKPSRQTIANTLAICGIRIPQRKSAISVN